VWNKLITNLANFIADIRQILNRFYAQTQVAGAAPKRFLLALSLLPSPLDVWNKLDIDGSGNIGLRIKLEPNYKFALPPVDGFKITIERVDPWGAGLNEVSALIFIGVDDGVFPVGILPEKMQFAYLGYLGESGKNVPETLTISLGQQADNINTIVTAQLGLNSAQYLVRVHAGLMTCPVTSLAAIDPSSNKAIQVRTGDITKATELVDVILAASMPADGTVSINPLEAKITTPKTGAGTLQATYKAPQVLKLAADVTTRSQFLFSVDSQLVNQLITDLNATVLSEALRREFLANCISLVSNALIKVASAGNSWTIDQNDMKYFVRRENQDLKVYRSEVTSSHILLNTNHMPGDLTLSRTDTYWFSVDPQLVNQLISDLDAKTLSKALLKEFETHGSPLASDTLITVEQAGNSWTIDKCDKSYLLRKEGQNLKVYAGSEIVIQPGEKLDINARLLTGSQSRQSIEPLLQPLQALVVESLEYLEGQELWAAIDGFAGALVRMTKTGPATTVNASLSIGDPLNPSTNLAPRSVRLFASMPDSADPEHKQLNYDVRASEIVPDAGKGLATISADVKFDNDFVSAKVTGRLRHLRALSKGSGSRIEAWMPLTPATVELSYDGRTTSQPVCITLRPSAVMAIGADYTDVAGIRLEPYAYARVFARLLFDSVINAHYGMVPRQPEIRGTAADGSTTSILRDTQATAFPPELMGMSLRYEGGANLGQTRTISVVGAGTLETSEPFPNPPITGDPFRVVATDLLFDVTQPLAVRSPRQGLSAAVSLGRTNKRLATRMNPQVLQVSGRTLLTTLGSSGPSVALADAVRIQGLRKVQLRPPDTAGQGWLHADIELDPNRAARSLRFAQDERQGWELLDSLERSHAITRVLLADAPDLVNVQGPPPLPLLLTRVGGVKPRVIKGEKQGWVRMELLQLRHTGGIAGLGIVSLDFVAIPQQVGIILGENLSEARRRTNGIKMLDTPPNWSLKSQAVTISGDDLRIERLRFASFWAGPPGANNRQSYPARNEDEWSMITGAFIHLHDAGVADQRLTVWQLDEKLLDNPDRGAGIGIEASGLTADLDLDQYRALLTPPPVNVFSPSEAVLTYFNIPWQKKVEIQLKEYQGAWLLDGGISPKYNAVEMGFWFLRAIDKIFGIGDAYFGNTTGTINGRTRPWGP